MIFFILIFLFFVIECGFIAWEMIALEPKKLYRINYGYLIPSDFTIVRARSVDKAVRKFERKHSMAKIYSVERVEEF